MSDIQNIKHVKKTPVYVFDRNGLEEAKSLSKYGTNWPVVYIIYDSYNKENGRKHLYVGETTSFSVRFGQHLDNAESGQNKEGMDYITVICNDTFHKSAILDFEQTLIRLFQADGYYEILNLNKGQSAHHDYYDRLSYTSLVPQFWDKLRNDFGKKLNVSQRIYISKGYQELINTDIYKYSPNITLTDEQFAVSLDVLLRTIEGLVSGKSCTSVINGGAGTGKTILAINMIYQLYKSELYNENEIDNSDDENISEVSIKLKKIIEKINEYKIKTGKEKLSIGFVVPMDSLRSTLTTVFNSVNMANIVISVADLANHAGQYDVVFVDESHRLTRREALQSYPDFDNKNKKLGLPKDSTQLDWVMLQSKTRVLFYDSEQSVRTRDISKEDFNRVINKQGSNAMQFNLLSQMRCGGGLPFTMHIDYIFRKNQNVPKKLELDEDVNYEFLFFENFKDMKEEIAKRDAEVGLSRLVSGISWNNWRTKAEPFDKYVKKNYHVGRSVRKYLGSLNEGQLRKINRKYIDGGNWDMDIDGVKMAWNSTQDSWVISPNATYEMGCIHTIQGYDVNYIGVVFGPEIDYQNGTFTIIKKPWRIGDPKSIEKKADEEILQTAINTYKVMLKRGVKGCYVYAYNEGLRKYLKKYIEPFKKTTL